MVVYILSDIKIKNMKKRKTSDNTPQENKKDKKVMTRKQAIKKAGIMSLTTATMLILMESPAKAAASAPTPPPAW